MYECARLAGGTHGKRVAPVASAFDVGLNKMPGRSKGCIDGEQGRFGVKGVEVGGVFKCEMGHGGAVLHGGCWGSAAQIVMQAAAPWANANFHSGGFRKRLSRQSLTDIATTIRVPVTRALPRCISCLHLQKGQACMGLCGLKSVARSTYHESSQVSSTGVPAGPSAPPAPAPRTASASLLCGLPRLGRRPRSVPPLKGAAADALSVRLRTPSPATARAAAAQIARDAANPNHPQYLDLSAAMCWDAVKHCAVVAHLLDATVDAQHGLVSSADAQVHGREAIAALPEGHAIGFFDDQRLVHVMLGVGNGRAAGNKNDCVGIGAPIGWETLNLNHLAWNADGCVTAPGLHQATRSLVVRSRLLGSATT